MEKKVLLLAVAIVVVCLCSSALALDPLGPPTAGLKQGEWGFGVDYSYSEMNLEFNSGEFEEWSYWYTYSDVAPDQKLKKMKMNKGYANLGYGIMDNWEAFLRLGGANVQWKAGPIEVLNCDDQIHFEGGTEFAFGFGTKATFLEQTPDLKWGVVFQVSWAESDDVQPWGEIDDPDSRFEDSYEMDFYEIQIAAGPTYKLREGFSIYGGPMLHFLKGDLDIKSREYDEGELEGTLDLSYDIEEESCFGGYIGAQFDTWESASGNIEIQLTGDAFALAVKHAWIF